MKALAHFAMAYRLQATLAEQRTALLRHSGTVPSETRADHVSYTVTLTTRSASFSPRPVLPHQCQSKSALPVRNAPLHSSLATVVFQPFNPSGFNSPWLATKGI